MVQTAGVTPVTHSQGGAGKKTSDMERCRERLPGVRRIWTVEPAGMPAPAEMLAEPVAVYSVLREVEFWEDATFGWKEERTAGGTVREASIEFKTAEVVPMQQGTGYVVEDMQGRRYLIGGGCAPWPKVTATAALGLGGSAAAGWTYRITHRSAHTALLCITAV